MATPAYYLNYPTLTPRLIGAFELLKKKAIREDTKKLLPESFAQLNVFEAFKAATDTAVLFVEKTLAALEDNDRDTQFYINQLYGCNKYQTYSIRPQLIANLRTVLEGPYPLRSSRTLYDCKFDSEEWAATNTRAGGDITTFSSGLINGQLILPLIPDFAMAEYNREMREMFIKTLIHEAIHRNLLNQILEFTEVYQHDYPEEFKNLGCYKHLRNADSYSFLATTIPKVKRLYSPQVVSGPIGLQLVLDIHERDNLWNIAKQIFQDGRKWEEIWNENKDTLRSKNPNLIFPGEKLRITLPEN